VEASGWTWRQLRSGVHRRETVLLPLVAIDTVVAGESLAPGRPREHYLHITRTTGWDLDLLVYDHTKIPAITARERR
jgi:hypothetical protein